LGFRPDLLVGASIGTEDAAVLAVQRAELGLADFRERLFMETVDADPKDSRIQRLAAEMSSGPSNYRDRRRFSERIIARGIPPDLRFTQIMGAWVALVGSDLDTGEPVLYGRDSGVRPLDRVMASAKAFLSGMWEHRVNSSCLRPLSLSRVSLVKEVLTKAAISRLHTLCKSLKIRLTFRRDFLSTNVDVKTLVLPTTGGSQICHARYMTHGGPQHRKDSNTGNRT
jgi:hypothetical protein